MKGPDMHVAMKTTAPLSLHWCEVRANWVEHTEACVSSNTITVQCVGYTNDVAKK